MKITKIGLNSRPSNVEESERTSKPQRFVLSHKFGKHRSAAYTDLTMEECLSMISSVASLSGMMISRTHLALGEKEHEPCFSQTNVKYPSESPYHTCYPRAANKHCVFLKTLCFIKNYLCSLKTLCVPCLFLVCSLKNTGCSLKNPVCTPENPMCSLKKTMCSF